jgi:hypothetical protein
VIELLDNAGSRLRLGQLSDEPCNNRVGIDPFGLSAKRRDDPMAKHWSGQGLNVLGRYVQSSMQ